MISYLITSSLLVVPAWLVYRMVVRQKASLRQQKGFLHLAVLGSLLFPLLMPNVGFSPPQPNPTVEAVGFGRPINHHSLQQYCRCENPNYAHRITYRANAWYNVLLEHKIWLSYAIFLAMGAVFLTFVVQLGYLRLLVSRSRKERIEIDGIPFVLLHTPRPHSVGTFWLGKAYIVWQEQLGTLTEQERHAVYRHELSHIQQLNTLEKAAFRLIQCLWWWNPIFYLIRNELNLLSEFLADESGASVLSKRQAYAHLLLNLQVLKSLPLGQHLRQSQLKTRIERLLQPPPPSQFPIWQIGLGMVLLLQIVTAAPLSTQVSHTLADLETYETIYHKVPADMEEAVYCTDCETVCTPDH